MPVREMTDPGTITDDAPTFDAWDVYKALEGAMWAIQMGATGHANQINWKQVWQDLAAAKVTESTIHKITMGSIREQD